MKTTQLFKYCFSAILILGLSFTFASESLAQTKAPVVANNDGKPHVNKRFDVQTKTAYYDFNSLLSMSDRNVMTEQKIAEYIAAYPEMHTSDHADLIRSAFPNAFTADRQRRIDLKNSKK